MRRKMLIVDDSAINRLLLKNTLRSDYDIVEAENGAEALDIMRREGETLSAVLMDVIMPVMDGYEALRLIKDDVHLADIPVLIVTGSEDEDSRANALSLGANDFIIKPFNPDIIKHCVKNNIAMREAASTLRAIQRDKLTGLYSREAFFDKVEELTSTREPGYYLLSCFDIDNFKLINDRYGSAEGDNILREVGKALSADMERYGGIAGRVSADNFTALLPVEHRDHSITEFLQYNRMAFSAKQSIVFSVGRYIIADLSLPASALYDRAYIAKQSIKGRYDEHIAYFDDAMLEKLIRDQGIIADTDSAVAERQFEVWYQPQFNHSTGAIVGAEALVRWRHPEKGLIPPGDFIPVFEQNGFVYKLDKYVWEEVCRHLQGWLSGGGTPVPVSVNVSRYDVFRPDFIEALTGLVKKYDIPAELLRLEITESAFASSTEVIVDIVKGLIERGFTVEIDDFGSGYSSFNTLKSVPAQVLKLDMRFLDESEGSERSGNILESIVRMAKWMGMSVIAEGVEDRRQADYLCSIGCSYIQGYVYARPMPVGEYERFCRDYGKESTLLTMDTVENLDNNSFWNPKSIDTLIFNSYVGAACIFEYTNGSIELLRVNKKFTAILGDGAITAAETLKLNWLTCLTPESLATVRGVLRRSYETREEYTREYEFLNIPGAPLKTWLRATMRVIATAGERMLVYCASENITAQRLAEENARRSERKKAAAAGRMQAILDNVDVGIAASVVRGGKTELLFANDRFYQLLGYTRAQFAAEVDGLYFLFAPEDMECAHDKLTRSLKYRDSDEIEAYMLRRDGSRILVRDAFSVCRFADVEEPVQLSMFRDITGERETELLQRRSAEQIQAIMRNMVSGVTAAIINDSGSIELLFSNDRFFEIHGYTREQYEAEVTDSFAVIHPEDRERVQREIMDAYTGERSIKLEYRVYRRDGELRWLIVSISSMRLTGTSQNVNLCVFSDITEEKLSEQAMRETDEQLRFLNSMSHELLAQPDAEAGINAALTSLMGYFDGERAYIFEFDMERRLASNTYEVCGEGISPEMGKLRNVPLSVVEYCFDSFEKRGLYIIDSVSALDDSRSGERQLLLEQGISSMFAVPLLRDGALIGAIGVDNPRRPLSNVDRLLALGDYIAVMLTRRDLDARISSDNRALSGMMSDMPGGFVRMHVADDGSVIPVYFNEGFSKLTGMNRDELKALYSGSILAGIHPDDVGVVTEAIANMKRDGGAHSSRYRLRHKNGGYIWLTTFGRITRDADGGSFMNTYFVDATERQQEEEAQKRLLDNLPGGAALFEKKGGDVRIIHLNKRYWELVDREPLSYEHITSDMSIHPEDYSILEQEYNAALREGRDFACDIRVRCGVSGYRPFRMTGHITPRANGWNTVSAVYTPITDGAMSIQEMLPVAMQAVMDASSEVTFVKGRDLRYFICSRKLAELAGFESETELIGKTAFDILPQNVAESAEEEDRAIFEGGGSHVDTEIEFPTKNGVRRLLMSKYPLLDSGGNVLGIYCTGRDITEAILARSRLEMLTNSIPGGIAMYEASPDNLQNIRLTYFSDGFARMLGYTREEYLRLTADNALTNIEPDDLAPLEDSIRALVRDGTPINCDYRAHTRDGGYKWINIRAVMGEPNGDRLTANAVFFDVTEMHDIVGELRVSEETSRLAIAQSGTMVCRFDIAARRLTVPENVASDIEQDKVVEGLPYKNIREGKVSPETQEEYVGFYESIIRGEEQGVARFQRRTAAGWRWTEAHFTTIFTNGGKPVTAVISFNDITESIQKNAAYKKELRSMMGRAPESYSMYHCNVSKNTVQDTSEGMLIPTEADASLVMTARTAEYAMSRVYKDDRNDFLQLMDRDGLLSRYCDGKDTGILEYREVLPSGETRWLRLTVDLLESPFGSDVDAILLFEDIDSAKRMELQTRYRAETDPLTGLLNRSAFTDRFKKLLETSRDGALCALFIVDLDGFKQVNDCFGHAVGDETLIELSQKLRDTFRGRDLVCRLGGDEFMVCMSGVTNIGAIKDRASLLCSLLHKSFSMDVQLSASIGIAVCPNDGNDFETLYRKADAALYHVKGLGKDNFDLYDGTMSDGARLTELKNETADQSGYGVRAEPKRRLLIVEDSEFSRKYLSALFENEFIVDVAESGEEALSRLSRYGSGISVVLLDLVMPGLNGFEVLQKMRESITMQSIPVIIVSGMDERESSLQAIKAGASDYITKPVDPDLLRLRVSSAISKAENERLRAQNRYLALQNGEARRLAEAKRHSEELALALHEAERADLAKSQFLSSMSHEIRTPLNAVIGYNTIARGELAAAATDSERRHAGMKVMDCLTKSEVASRHLLTIINDVLDISAIESGKLRVESAPFDFRGLINSLTVLFFAQARAKGVNLEVLFDRPTDEWLVGDQLRINQILTNLLSNAVKFTPEGGSVTLTIAELAADADTARCRFTVADTGIGMTPEYLEHIWTPFEQAEASISRRFGGTGLGLSITKSLVDLMGGKISVESKSGAGSKFTVELSLKRTEQPMPGASIDFSGVNALAVDDDPSTCDYIKLLFLRCGARCTTFTSGREAVRAFAAAKALGNPFTLCLVDWRMPDMDGYATISELRRVAAKELPVVVVTAYDFSEVSDNTEKLGITRFISKPLFQSSLFDLLATVVGHEAEHLQPQKKNAPDLSGARILLAEDNSMNMEVARHILMASGAAVDSAWNGQEAVDMFAASAPGTYSAILMDVHMPVVDGYDATRVIRGSAHPDALTVPIIAMTADVFAEDVAEARDAGMDDHVAKPIDVDALFDTLAKHIGGKHGS